MRRTTRAADDFRQLLAPGAIRAVFQPIVRLSDLQPIGYEGLARFPTPPGLVSLPPDVTLAAAGRLGVREDLEVACWAAISEAGTPPAGRLLFVNVAPDALGHPGLLELAGQPAGAAGDRAHRAGRRPEHRPAAPAPAAVDRPRRADRRRRRRSGVHVAGVRRRAAPGLPQALPRHGHRRRPGRGAARPCCAPPSPSPARSAPASSPRAWSARRSSRSFATPRSTTARAGCSAARRRPGRPEASAPARRRRRARPPGRLERELAAATSVREAVRGDRRAPRPQRA